MAGQVADLISPLTGTLVVTLASEDTHLHYKYKSSFYFLHELSHLILAHVTGLAVAVSAALGVAAGQPRLGAHAAGHLRDQGAVGVLVSR